MNDADDFDDADVTIPGGLDPATLPFSPMLCGGLSLHVSAALTGSKRAIKQGNRLCVSPAMMELIRGADGERELRVLLENIEALEIPEMPRVADFCLPMTMVGEPRPANYAAAWLDMQAFTLGRK